MTFGVLAGMFTVAPFRASLLSFVSLLLLAPALAFAQTEATGRLSGQAVNANNGLGVTNAVVTIAGTALTARTDLAGRYLIENVPVGACDLTVAKDGFRPLTVTAVKIAARETAKVDLPLTPAESVIKLEALTVSGEVVSNSGIGLMAARQKAAAVSDAIGGEQFSRLAAGNAAEALAKMTGASVVGGKYVLIRGLGDRYSNTLLNGTAVPSADPDKRAVQMDQFPSDLIDAITTTKSFTPDQPGGFSGGSINVKTKAFPENFFASIATSVEYNENTTGKDILGAPLGGDRAPNVPEVIPSRTLAEISARQGNFAPAEELDRATKAFAGTGIFPRTIKADPNFSSALALGNRHGFGAEGVFAYTASLLYDRSFSNYDGGEMNRFIGTADAPQNRLVLTSDRELLSFDPATAVTAPTFGVTSSTQSTRRGGFAKLALRPSADHEMAFDLIYNVSSDSTIRRGVGEEANNYVGSVFEVYDMLNTDREIGSAQLSGRSLFPSLGLLEISWRASLSNSTQDQPDYRTLAAIYTPEGAFVNATGVQPNRFFRELDEDAAEGGIDVTYPLGGSEGKYRLKAGGVASHNERTYHEQRFQYALNPRTREQLVAFPNPVGIVSRTESSVTFGNTIQRLQEPNNYEGDQRISAFYAMGDAQLTPKFRVIGGVRFETTKMRTVPTATIGSTPKIGEIDQQDPLPALSLVYASSPKTNWRAAYGRTVARPTYKELTDIRYEDVFTGDVYLGNPALELTVIDNFDLRWEWFPRKGETLAVSAFYKRFDQPIEVLYQSSVGSIQPQNVDGGTVYGCEFEFRRGLGFFGERFDAFSVGANLTLVKSEVTIPPVELALLRTFDPGASNKRELLGQSPYVLNFDVSYDPRAWGTAVTLSFNVVGRRLDLVNFGPLPDVYEQPAPQLNLVITQRLSEHWRLKFSAKNLLDPDYEKTIRVTGRELAYSRYTLGRTFAFGVTASF